MLKIAHSCRNAILWCKLVCRFVLVPAFLSHVGADNAPYTCHLAHHGNGKAIFVTFVSLWFLRLQQFRSNKHFEILLMYNLWRAHAWCLAATTIVQGHLVQRSSDFTFGARRSCCTEVCIVKSLYVQLAFTAKPGTILETRRCLVKQHPWINLWISKLQNKPHFPFVNQINLRCG